jgi:uncharacterized protein (DUF58 family)
MLSADEAGQLDRLAIAAGTAAPAAGRKVINARGHSLEFHDYRGYQPGDDPRSIDWTVHARLRQLVVRIFRADGHVPVHLLVDTSASMRAGHPAKLAATVKAAAALAYIAVRRRDPVSLAMFSDTIGTHVAPGSGRPQLFRIFDALTSVEARGPSSLDRALTMYGAAVRGPGLAIVMSDFFDAHLTLDGVRYLLSRGLRVALVQVLANDELDPRIEDDVEIVDLEDASAPPVVVTRGALEAYHAHMRRASADLHTFAASRSLPFIRLVSSCGFGEIVSGCSGAGLVERHG